MPNGDDKSWLRVCWTIDGYREKYVRWPIGVRLPPAYFEIIVGHILSPIGFAFVSSIVELVSDDDLSAEIAIIATGHDGTEFRYGDHEFDNPEFPTYQHFGSAVKREGLDRHYGTVFNANGEILMANKTSEQKGVDQVAAVPKPASMPVMDFLDQADNTHSTQGNPGVLCNALYKAEENFNCYLTPVQAIALARNLLQKAQLLLDENLEDGVVHL